MSRLTPLWRWYRARSTRAQWVIGGITVLVVLGITGAAVPSDDEEPAQTQATALATASGPDTGTPAATATAAITTTQAPTSTPTPTRTPSPTPTPRPPTPTPTPTPEPLTPTPMPTPITLQGRGQTATDPIPLSFPISVVTLTHAGASNFIVKAFQGTEEKLLVNVIGRYQGSRPLFDDAPVTFDIRADGAWTIKIEPVAIGGSPSFSGRGDAVSPIFNPPSGAGAWEIRHTGSSNFIVWLRCLDREQLIQNLIGPTSGSRVISFSRGPCLWDVRGDGEWSLAPRQ